METRAYCEETWWTVPKNFHLPLVFYMEEEQEECASSVGSPCPHPSPALSSGLPTFRLSQVPTLGCPHPVL